MKSWVFLMLSCGVALGAETDLLRRGIDAFERGSRAWDLAEMSAAAALFDEARGAAPDSRLAHYWAGVAAFHAALMTLGGGDDEGVRRAEPFLDRATAALQRATALDRGDAESHALLGAIVGLRMAASPSTWLWRGPAWQRHRRQALRFGADNPRIHYLAGMSALHAPAPFGGARKARDSLVRAAQLFEAERAAEGSPTAPRWGYDHCQAFLGKVYEAMEDRERAATHYRRSLAANARHPVALEGLARCMQPRPVESL